jgi:mono/diheme cytochrome c family protein
MKRIYAPYYLIFAVLVALFGLAANAQQQAVKTVSPVGAHAIDGKGLYMEFCAVCHGRDGRGNGPAAAFLKMEVTDLTQLTRGSKGRFPDTKVLAILNGDAATGAHGNREMPVWGKTFNDMSSLSVAQGRKHALVSYLESIQAK